MKELSREIKPDKLKGFKLSPEFERYRQNLHAALHPEEVKATPTIPKLSTTVKTITPTVTSGSSFIGRPAVTNEERTRMEIASTPYVGNNWRANPQGLKPGEVRTLKDVGEAGKDALDLWEAQGTKGLYGVIYWVNDLSERTWKSLGKEAPGNKRVKEYAAAMMKLADQKAQAIAEKNKDSEWKQTVVTMVNGGLSLLESLTMGMAIQGGNLAGQMLANGGMKDAAEIAIKQLAPKYGWKVAAQSVNASIKKAAAEVGLTKAAEWVPAVTLSALEGGGIYKELTDEGKSPARASTAALLSIAGTAVSECIELNFMYKTWAKNTHNALAARIVNALTEASWETTQELGQNLWQNTIRRFVGQDDKQAVATVKETIDTIIGIFPSSFLFGTASFNWGAFQQEYQKEAEQIKTVISENLDVDPQTAEAYAKEAVEYFGPAARDTFLSGLQVNGVPIARQLDLTETDNALARYIVNTAKEHISAGGKQTATQTTSVWARPENIVENQVVSPEQPAPTPVVPAEANAEVPQPARAPAPVTPAEVNRTESAHLTNSVSAQDAIKKEAIAGNELYGTRILVRGLKIGDHQDPDWETVVHGYNNDGDILYVAPINDPTNPTASIAIHLQDVKEVRELKVQSPAIQNQVAPVVKQEVKKVSRSASDLDLDQAWQWVAWGKRVGLDPDGVWYEYSAQLVYRGNEKHGKGFNKQKIVAIWDTTPAMDDEEYYKIVQVESPPNIGQPNAKQNEPIVNEQQNGIPAVEQKNEAYEKRAEAEKENNVPPVLVPMEDLNKDIGNAVAGVGTDTQKKVENARLILAGIGTPRDLIDFLENDGMDEYMYKAAVEKLSDFADNLHDTEKNNEIIRARRILDFAYKGLQLEGLDENGNRIAFPQKILEMPADNDISLDYDEAKKELEIEGLPKNGMFFKDGYNGAIYNLGYNGKRVYRRTANIVDHGSVEKGITAYDILVQHKASQALFSGIIGHFIAPSKDIVDVWVDKNIGYVVAGIIDDQNYLVTAYNIEAQNAVLASAAAYAKYYGGVDKGVLLDDVNWLFDEEWGRNQVRQQPQQKVEEDYGFNSIKAAAVKLVEKSRKFFNGKADNVYVPLNLGYDDNHAVMFNGRKVKPHEVTFSDYLDAFAPIPKDIPDITEDELTESGRILAILLDDGRVVINHDEPVLKDDYWGENDKATNADIKNAIKIMDRDSIPYARVAEIGYFEGDGTDEFHVLDNGQAFNSYAMRRALMRWYSKVQSWSHGHPGKLQETYPDVYENYQYWTKTIKNAVDAYSPVKSPKNVAKYFLEKIPGTYVGDMEVKSDYKKYQRSDYYVVANIDRNEPEGVERAYVERDLGKDTEAVAEIFEEMGIDTTDAPEVKIYDPGALIGMNKDYGTPLKKGDLRFIPRRRAPNGVAAQANIAFGNVPIEAWVGDTPPGFMTFRQYLELEQTPKNLKRGKPFDENAHYGERVVVDTSGGCFYAGYQNHTHIMDAMNYPSWMVAYGSHIIGDSKEVADWAQNNITGAHIYSAKGRYLEAQRWAGIVEQTKQLIEAHPEWGLKMPQQVLSDLVVIEAKLKSHGGLMPAFFMMDGSGQVVSHEDIFEEVAEPGLDTDIAGRGGAVINYDKAINDYGVNPEIAEEAVRKNYYQKIMWEEWGAPVSEWEGLSNTKELATVDFTGKPQEAEQQNVSGFEYKGVKYTPEDIEDANLLFRGFLDEIKDPSAPNVQHLINRWGEIDSESEKIARDKNIPIEHAITILKSKILSLYDGLVYLESTGEIEVDPGYNEEAYALYAKHRYPAPALEKDFWNAVDKFGKEKAKEVSNRKEQVIVKSKQEAKNSVEKLIGFIENGGAPANQVKPGIATNPNQDIIDLLNAIGQPMLPMRDPNSKHLGGLLGNGKEGFINFGAFGIGGNGEKAKGWEVQSKLNAMREAAVDDVVDIRNMMYNFGGNDVIINIRMAPLLMVDAINNGMAPLPDGRTQIYTKNQPAGILPFYVIGDRLASAGKTFKELDRFARIYVAAQGYPVNVESEEEINLVKQGSIGKVIANAQALLSQYSPQDFAVFKEAMDATRAYLLPMVQQGMNTGMIDTEGLTAEQFVDRYMSGAPFDSEYDFSTPLKARDMENVSKKKVVGFMDGIFNSMLQLYKAEQTNEFIRYIAETYDLTSEKATAISYWENGVRKYVDAPEHILRQMKLLNSRHGPESKIFNSDWYRKAMYASRQMKIFTPNFAMTNIVRDATLAFERVGVHPATLVKTFIDVVTGQAKKSAGLTYLAIGDLDATVPKTRIKRILEYMKDNVLGVSESFMRNYAMNATANLGGSEMARYATLFGGTADFSVHGASGKVMNVSAALQFAKAGLNVTQSWNMGLRDMMRDFDSPNRAVRLNALNRAVYLILLAIMGIVFKEREREKKELQDYVTENKIPIRIGDKILAIPEGYSIGMSLENTIAGVIAGMRNQDTMPQILGRMAQDTFSGVMGIIGRDGDPGIRSLISTMTPTAIEPLVRSILNVSYGGREIDAFEYGKQYTHYYNNTSKVAIRIASRLHAINPAIDLSPIKLEFVLKSYLGRYGNALAVMDDEPAAGVFNGLKNAAAYIAQQPFFISVPQGIKTQMYTEWKKSYKQIEGDLNSVARGQLRISPAMALDLIQMEAVKKAMDQVTDPTDIFALATYGMDVFETYLEHARTYKGN